MALIELRNLGKTYDPGGVKVVALHGVTLDIEEGEFVALIGPSGSGKSTLMNTLGCLDRPTEGSFCLAGEEVAGLGPEELARTRNRRIGFVFQNFNLLSRTTALENVDSSAAVQLATARAASGVKQATALLQPGRPRATASTTNRTSSPAASSSCVAIARGAHQPPADPPLRRADAGTLTRALAGRSCLFSGSSTRKRA